MRIKLVCKLALKSFWNTTGEQPAAAHLGPTTADANSLHHIRGGAGSSFPTNHRCQQNSWSTRAGQQLFALTSGTGKQATSSAAEDGEFTATSHRAPAPRPTELQRTPWWGTCPGGPIQALHTLTGNGKQCWRKGKLRKQPTPTARECFPTFLGEMNSYMAWGSVEVKKKK